MYKKFKIFPLLLVTFDHILNAIRTLLGQNIGTRPAGRIIQSYKAGAKKIILQCIKKFQAPVAQNAAEAPVMARIKARTQRPQKIRIIAADEIFDSLVFGSYIMHNYLKPQAKSTAITGFCAVITSLKNQNLITIRT